MRVELLYFHGCPNWQPTKLLVERVANELDVDVDVEAIPVIDEDAVERLRFLGSPSVRVNHRDVEPGADQRSDFSLSCRLYSSGGRISAEPEEGWIRYALLEES